MSAALTFDNFAFSYQAAAEAELLTERFAAQPNQDGRPLIGPLCTEIEEGSFTLITGATGCGKTTLLRAALGMLGQAGEVCGGSIRFAGKDVSSMTQAEHLSFVSTVASLVSQNPQRAFSPVRTLGSQFEETALLRGELSKGEARARATSLLGRLGLSDPERVLDSYVFELSGGMAQRAAIGLALMNSPKVVFADEPTSALDVAVQAQVVEELISANREFGVSLLVVSHNIAVIAHMAQYLYVMKDGEVVEQGPSEQVIACPQHPYTRQLIASVPKLRSVR